jgi:glutaminase
VIVLEGFTLIDRLLVDGQQFSYGDASEEFCIQSCSKPFMYCLVCETLGSKEVRLDDGCRLACVRG